MKMKLQHFAEPQKGVVGRWQHPGYINVAKTGVGTATYELLGFGVTQLDDSPGAQTSSKRYVNQKSATQTVSSYEWTAPLEFDLIRSEKAIEFLAQTVSSYEWTAPLEFDLIRSEKAIEFLADIGENEKTGADAETDYVIVYLEKPVDSKEGSYEAKRRRVAVEISEFSDNDGEIQGSGNLLGVGEWVKGTFDTKTKTFTEAGAAA